MVGAEDLHAGQITVGSCSHHQRGGGKVLLEEIIRVLIKREKIIHNYVR